MLSFQTLVTTHSTDNNKEYCHGNNNNITVKHVKFKRGII